VDLQLLRASSPRLLQPSLHGEGKFNSTRTPANNAQTKGCLGILGIGFDNPIPML
jgi:hypothetical protein